MLVMSERGAKPHEEGAHTMTTTIRIRNTEDAVAVIAAYTTKVIAASNHPGHDLDTVGNVMTSDLVLDTIRTAYNCQISSGFTPRQAVINVGQAAVAHYCNKAGIPTSK